MRYACLVYVDGTKLDALNDAERRELRRAVVGCEAELRSSGYLAGSEQLSCVRTATTLRVRDGRQLTGDGPAVETAQQLGGFFLLEARDLNDAIRLAATHPAARFGAIEIRPVSGASVGAGTGAGTGAGAVPSDTPRETMRKKDKHFLA